LTAYSVKLEQISTGKQADIMVVYGASEDEARRQAEDQIRRSPTPNDLRVATITAMARISGVGMLTATAEMLTATAEMVQQSTDRNDLYETDIVTWSEQQADLLRRHASNELDWDNLAEEIDDVGHSQRDALESRIATVLLHLFKLEASPAMDPRAGWRETVREQRRGIQRVLKRNQPLRQQVATIINDEMAGARDDALASLADYNEQPRVDMTSVTFTEEQVLGPWLPD
jgi:hypothetical protein